MTLDAILLARALRHEPTACFLKRCLDLHREPTDRADAVALRAWRRIMPLLPIGASGLDACLETDNAAHCRPFLQAALSVPDYLAELAGPTAELVAVFNAGRGSGWRLPVIAAPDAGAGA